MDLGNKYCDAAIDGLAQDCCQRSGVLSYQRHWIFRFSC